MPKKHIRTRKVHVAFAIVLVLILILLSGCKGRTALDISTPEPVPTRAAPHPFEVAWDDRELFREGLVEEAQAVLDTLPGATVYHLDIKISEDRLSLKGREELRYTNQEDVPLDAFYFRLFPNVAGGVLTVSMVSVDAQAVDFDYGLLQSADSTEPNEPDKSSLYVPLPAPLQPGEQLEVQLDFEVKVAQDMGGNYGLFGYFDGVLVLDEFYPVIPVYDDAGWHASAPPPNGDVTYLDASFYLVRVTAPAELVVVASGVEVGREYITPLDQLGFSAARSAPACGGKFHVDGQSASGSGKQQVLTFAAGPARDFYLAASERYAVAQAQVGETTVNSYAFAGRAERNKVALGYAKDALQHYSARFGTYPYTGFDVVSTPMLALGIEYPGIVGISLKLYDPGATVYGLPSQVVLESTVAHEVAHQWFYNVVGNDQVHQPWLDEALVQYITGLYYQDTYGGEAAESYRASWSDNWGRVGRAEIPIGWPSAAYEQEQYSPIVYGRGPYFMMALADEMGQNAFDAFLRDYYTTHMWGIGTGDAFERLAEQHCECDLGPLFEAWVGDSPLPPHVEQLEGGTPPSADTPFPPSGGDLEGGNPFALISQDTLFAFLEDLTAIQAYSGWRNSATEGEAEALEYVAGKLAAMPYLESLGMTLERQQFNVFLSTELWETRLHLTVGSEEVEVPADGLRGPRDEIAQALRFDSDGVLNDFERDPVVVDGPVVLVQSAAELETLSAAEVQDKLVFLNYAVINKVLAGREHAKALAESLFAKGPAGLVLVTQFSTELGSSHGFVVGDNSILNDVRTRPAIPVLYARLEDMAPAGISTWEDLVSVEAARVTWDADVFSPGTSGNLVAHIPGADAEHAVILGAHIDSPNGPGAMDDGSGVVLLLEVARVLDAAQTQPGVDLYLTWFGSEELGLYGASHFALTHQDLLDRTLAMLEIDDLTRPLDGIDATLDLVTWSYADFRNSSPSGGRVGGGEAQLSADALPWPDYLTQAAAQRGIETVPQDFHFAYSDNTVFTGFDVPNADLIYENVEAMEATGSFHYAAMIHCPYDTVDLAREVGDVLEQMAHVVLAAALDTGQAQPVLRVTTPPSQRALFIGSHTESVHLTPAALTDLGMAFSWEGLDVDLIPYGQPVTPADLADVSLVIVLPTHDYPSPDGDPNVYDTAWREEEIVALDSYVAQGGLLVLTNSALRPRYGLWDPNEDWEDLNALASRFGVTYDGGYPSGDTIRAGAAQLVATHPLLEGVSTLEIFWGNAVPFDVDEGVVLAQASGEPVAALIDYGDAGGQVLALADIGMLSAGRSGPTNLRFWQNLAQYALAR